MLLLRFAPARVEWSALGWQTDLRTLCRDVNMYPLSSFWFAAAAPCGMGATIKTEGAYRLGEDQECWRYFRSIAFRTMVSFYPPVLFQPVSPRSTCTRRVWKRAPQHRCGLPYRPRPNRSVHAEADVLVSLQSRTKCSDSVSVMASKILPICNRKCFRFQVWSQNCRASDEEPYFCVEARVAQQRPRPRTHGHAKRCCCCRRHPGYH